MTVYIGGTELVAQLQRERDEAIAENLKLRKHSKETILTVARVLIDGKDGCVVRVLEILDKELDTMKG